MLCAIVKPTFRVQHTKELQTHTPRTRAPTTNTPSQPTHHHTPTNPSTRTHAHLPPPRTHTHDTTHTSPAMRSFAKVLLAAYIVTELELLQRALRSEGCSTAGTHASATKAQSCSEAVCRCSLVAFAVSSILLSRWPGCFVGFRDATISSRPHLDSATQCRCFLMYSRTPGLTRSIKEEGCEVKAE